MRGIRLCALALAMAVGSSSAYAQDAATAQILFQNAQILLEQRRYGEALESLHQSDRLVPRPDVTLTIAETYRLLHRWTEAYNWYERYLTRFSLDEAARTAATNARDALLRRVAVLDIGTDPAGATLYVDEAPSGIVGTSPARVAVAPGAHAVIAQLDRHREARQEIDAPLGRITAVSLALAPLVGTLAVTTSPPGAEVILEGRDEPLGTTPLEASLPIGPARVTVRLRGYAEGSRSITIEDGRTASLALTLEPLASSIAGLSVTTAPPGATVLIDGSEVGTTPLALSRIEPRAHRVELRLEGRGPWIDERVLFEAGGTTRVEATLEDPSAIHFEDLRWIAYGLGAAAVLAGGGAGIGALLERDAFYASDNPTRSQLELVGALNTAADALVISGVVVLAAALIVDLAIGPRPRSRARVQVDR